MSSSHRITKLDKRYTGSNYFEYIAESFRRDGYYVDYESYIKLRNWCWEVWGPAVELDLFFERDLKDTRNLHWSWQARDKDLRIYFKGIEETSMFQLQWGYQNGTN